MFDWQRLFDQRSISYVESGPNVVRGNLAINCPFCGDDPSEHLNVNPAGYWFCMRNREHSGRRPTYLLQHLLGISREEARRMSGNTPYIPDDFASRVQAIMAPPPPPPKHKLQLPPEFKVFNQLPSCRPYRQYLEGRGFRTPPSDLLYCTRGPFKGRIIFPIEMEGKLCTWTGRSIFQVAQLRYLTLSVEPERAEKYGLKPALGPITDYLLWYDSLIKVDADTICLVEGPFDALKVRELGKQDGVVATCCFTSRPTQIQIELLHELLPRFKRRYLLLDRGTLPTALKVTGELAALRVVPIEMPAGIKDPGDLKTRQQLLSVLAKRA